MYIYKFCEHVLGPGLVLDAKDIMVIKTDIAPSSRELRVE